jgi:RHS repeat-associated protein
MYTGADKNDATSSPTSTTQPDNSYRYNAMRWDSSTGQYDMGFRNYDPSINQFVSRDMYEGALDDAGLAADPFTGSRYAFGDGNPISNIENDGHMPCITGGPCGGLKALEAWAANQPVIANTHDQVVADTVPLIEARLAGMGITNFGISTDLSEVGKAANTIPGAERTGNGGNGIADVIVWTKKTVWIWEVKSSGGNAKLNGTMIPNVAFGKQQLARYISNLQEKLNAEKTGQTVEAGFGLPPSASEAVGKSGIVRTWSGSPAAGEQGLRLYSPPQEPKRQPQEQPQPQEQENPCLAAYTGVGCGGGVPAPGLPYLPVPAPGGVPMPGLPEFPVPEPVFA